MAVSGIDLGKYKLGWADSTDDYAFIPKKGLNEEIVREISGQKNEPDWMRDFRLKSLKRFRQEHADDRLRRHLLLPEADRQG
jgi:Fe-S cluster assembly protein SufB